MNLPANPHAIVEIDGIQLDSWGNAHGLMSVTVELTMDKASEACIQIVDPDWKVTDRHLVNMGLKNLSARIWMGFGRALGEPIFKGLFIEHGHDGQTATFKFHDKSARMKREKKTRYHTRMTDFEVLRRLAEDNEMGLVIGEGATDSEPHDSLPQRGVTDWKLAKQIAARSGFRLYVVGDTLFAQPAGKTSPPALSLNYRSDFVMMRPINLSYRLPENRHGSPKAVRVRGRRAGGTQLTGSSDENQRGVEHVEVHRDLTHHTEREARRRASAKRQLMRDKAYEHRIQLLPNYGGGRVVLGGMVALTGLGAFYSGTYAVAELRKEFRPGVLRDELLVKRDLQERRAR